MDRGSAFFFCGEPFFFSGEVFFLFGEALEGKEFVGDSLVSIPTKFNGFKSGDLGEFNRMVVFFFAYLKLK